MFEKVWDLSTGREAFSVPGRKSEGKFGKRAVNPDDPEVSLSLEFTSCLLVDRNDSTIVGHEPERTARGAARVETVPAGALPAATRRGGSPANPVSGCGMTFHWLNEFRKSLKPHRKTIRAHKLQTESLEDRTVPSTLLAGHGTTCDCPICRGTYAQSLTAPDPLAAAQVSTAPLDLTQTFNLHSLPGATRVIYLDFNGEDRTMFNDGWGNVVTPAYDIDGNPASFSDTEKGRIQRIWQRVAEKYSPFNVDVTTQDPGAAVLNKTSSTKGQRVIIGGDGAWDGFPGGVANVGSFTDNTDTPCFVFSLNLGNGDEKFTADAIAHEVGHTLGLSHQGTSTAGYYQGQGTGDTGWAPIMGVGYYKNLVTWSKGEYTGANNHTDELATIVSYLQSVTSGPGYRADDVGNTNATAGGVAMNGASLSAFGIIETTGDIDVFAFTTAAGTVSLNINGDPLAPMLDVYAQIVDGSNNVIATANDTSILNASFNLTLAAGTYYLKISGTGNGSPTATGYSNYSSLGHYSITGTVATAATLPTPTITAAPASFVNSTSANFTFTVSDPGGLVHHLEISLDGGAFTTAVGGSQNYSGLAAGAHTFRVRAVDASGNTGAVATANWTVDTALPTASITASPASFVNSTSASFNFSGSDASSGLNRLEISLDGGAFTTAAGTTANYSGLAAGAHNFRVRAVDNAGNVGNIVTANWTIDTALPTASITASPSSFVNSTSATFNFSGSDASSGLNRLEISLDGGAFTTAVGTTANYSALATGAHNFRVRAVDNAGNVGNIVTANWTIDTTLPTATITSSPSGFVNVTGATFNFSGSDASSGLNRLEISLDNAAFTTATSSITYTNLTEGAHNFRLRAVDNAGNVGNIVTANWTIDTTLPTANVTSSPSGFVNVTSATFNFSGSDASSGLNRLEISLDNAAFTTATTSITYTNLTAGAHNFRVRAVDNAGNVGNIVTANWTIDTTLPTASITASPSGFVNVSGATFNFSGSDASSGLNRLEISLDNAAFTTATASITYTNLTAGAHNFRVRAVDNAGNVGTIVTANWTIDTTLPTATITASPASLVNVTSATFNFSGTDAGSGLNRLEVSLDNAAFTTATGPITYNSLSVGAHNFRVRAVDNAGNVGNIVTANWTIDLSSPIVTLNSKPASIDTGLTASFGFTTSDPSGSGINRVEYSLDGSAFTTTSSPTVISTPEGNHLVRFRAVNNLGTTGGETTWNWSVDRTAPTATITSSPTTNTTATTASFSFSAVDPTVATVSSGVNRVEVSLDGSAFTTAVGSTSYSALSVGTHNFRVRAIDNAGNVGPAASFNWTVNGIVVLPAPTITTEPPALTNTTLATFGFAIDAAIPISTLESLLTGPDISASGSSDSHSAQASWSVNSEGVYTFTTYAIDLLGNPGPSATYQFTVDHTLPTISFTSSTPTGLTTSRNASFTFTAADAVSGGVASGLDRLEASLDGAAFTVIGTSAAFSNLADGVHTFRIRSFDRAGNVSTIATQTWTVDATAPSLSLTLKPPLTTTSRTATFNYSVTDATGVSRVEASLDGGAFTLINGQTSYNNLSRGTHNFRIRAVDTLGNATAITSYNWSIVKSTIQRTVAVGSGPGEANTIQVVDPSGLVVNEYQPFPSDFTGGVRTASADLNGDGVADVVAGTGPGASTDVVVTDGATGATLFSIQPFESAFKGGVFTAFGDVNGDGFPDIIISPDEGGGPRIRIFDGKTFGQIADFFGIDDPNFRGGARAGIGDVNGDGVGDLIVAAGYGGGPRVAVFDGTSVGSDSPRKLFSDFFALEATLTNGVYLTAGDVNGDGAADLIVGGGPGGGPRVVIFDGAGLMRGRIQNVADFFAGDVENRGGVRVSVKDLDGDSLADLVVGGGEGSGTKVTAYTGAAIIASPGSPAEWYGLDALPGSTSGVFVG